VPGVARDTNDRVDEVADQRGRRQQQPDLGVREIEVGADQRPGGREETEDELVEELDREQDCDEAGGSTPAEDAELAGRARAVHEIQSSGCSTADRKCAGAFSQ
jgi:hypothetical protein